jgi:hypothetical protein
MHRATLAGTERGTRCSGSLRTRALENRLARDGTARGWARRCSGRGLADGRSRLDRRLVHRTRAGLRHDHARRWSANGRCGPRRSCCCRRRSSGRRLRSGGSGNCGWRSDRWCRRLGRRGNWSGCRGTGRRGRWRRRRSNHGGSGPWLWNDQPWCRRRFGCWLWRRRRFRNGRSGLGLDGRCGWRSGLRRGRRSGGLLLLRNQLHYVAGLGNMGEIDLGLDLVVAANRAS